MFLIYYNWILNTEKKTQTITDEKAGVADNNWLCKKRGGQKGGGWKGCMCWMNMRSPHTSPGASRLQLATDL